MQSATKILRNRIALIFDFDETLGPNTTRILFEHLGLDFEAFSKKVTFFQEEQMWQPPLAKAEVLRQFSHQDDSPLNRQAMEEVGKNFPLYKGVEDLTKRLRDFTKKLDADIALEFILLTAGFKTIPAASKIGKDFDRLYAGELLFGDDGKILGAKRVISHIDKVHYVRQYQQGIPLNEPSDLENTFLDHNPDDHYIPMSQIIYLGDGSSDMSAFQEVEQGGGLAIGVDPDGDGSNWSGYDRVETQRRVHNLAKAKYGESDELYQSLLLGIESIVKKIQLLRFGKYE